MVENYYIFTTNNDNIHEFEFLIPKSFENLKNEEKLKNNLNIFKCEEGNVITVQMNAEIEGRINVFFNMTTNRTLLKSMKYHFPNFLNFIKYIVIYTDCISPQLFGDTFTQCLRVIAVQNTSEGVINRFEAPFYVPVSKNQISDINIAIKDLEGKPIKFSNPFSQVIVKLHFQKKRE